MQFFIHCNFFCQEYKFAYLLVYFAYFTYYEIYSKKEWLLFQQVLRHCLGWFLS